MWVVVVLLFLCPENSLLADWNFIFILALSNLNCAICRPKTQGRHESGYSISGNRLTTSDNGEGGVTHCLTLCWNMYDLHLMQRAKGFRPLKCFEGQRCSSRMTSTFRPIPVAGLWSAKHSLQWTILQCSCCVWTFEEIKVLNDIAKPFPQLHGSMNKVFTAPWFALLA